MPIDHIPGPKIHLISGGGHFNSIITFDRFTHQKKTVGVIAHWRNVPIQSILVIFVVKVHDVYVKNIL